MVPGPPPAPPLRVAIVDSDVAFAAVAASGLCSADLEVLVMAPPPIDLVDRLVAWRAEVVVLDLHLYGPETGRAVVPELKGRGIDVVLTTEEPATTVVDHCPVHDKGRPRTALHALVEAVRRRRRSSAAYAD
jgi:hypothetical protein